MTPPELIDPNIVGQYTANTQVILSFGAAMGGFEFAMQLRWDLMKRLYNMQWNSDPARVYLDAESLKNESNTSYNWDNQLGIYKMKNHFWASFYQGAMSQAKCMIFLFTQQWLNSQYCWEELQWYRQRLEGPTAIKPIFVVFPDARHMLSTQAIVSRDGKRHNPSHIWESMLKVPKAAKVDINTIADQSIRSVSSIAGHSYSYRYACSEPELNQILHHVATA